MFFKIKKTETLKNFAVLISGAGVAQALPILVSPIITRLYSPLDFGYLTFMLSTVSIVSILATARYELAIVLPKEDQEAIDILKLCLIIAVLVTLIIFLLIYTFADSLFSFFKLTPVKNLIFFIPLSLLIMGFYQPFNYYLIREKKFVNISKSKIGQSLILVTSRLGFGFSNLAFLGLVLSELIGQFAGLLIQIRYFGNNFKTNTLSGKRLVYLLKRYKEFPLYNMIPSLLDSFTLVLPVFFVTKFYNTEIAGHLGLSTRILTVPASIIATSKSQVLLQKITEMRNKNQDVLSFVLDVVKKFSLAYFLPCMLLIIYGQKIFTYIFGKNWDTAGLFAQYLSLPFFIRLIVSPLSVAFIAFQKVRIGAIWQMSYFFISFAVLFYASRHDSNFFILIYAINEIVMYLLYLVLIIYTIKR